MSKTMPQTINNENEYRLTRSKALSERQENTNEMGRYSTHMQTTGKSVSAQAEQSERDDISGSQLINGNTIMGRRYLGDVSNQYGLSGQRANASSRKQALGNANAQFQPQHRILVKPEMVEGENENQYGMHKEYESAKDEVNDQFCLNKISTVQASSELGTSSFSENFSNKNIAIPARLPQKRQATESSTNLVEKLHVTNPQENLSHKKSRIIDYEWQDLDEEDMDDPLMVSDYVNDIFRYLHELELKTLPDSQYLFKQKHLRPKMRSILVDWLVEMHGKFRLLPETLYLAINIMDRFMSLEIVQIDKLQLLATGSLFIAAKFEEVFSPSVKNYAYFTDGSYTEEEILQAEKYILKILNFDLNYPNPMNFLRRISKADDYDVQSRTLGKYLLEISVVDHKFIGMLPSLCAASAMYIARLILGKMPLWTGNLIHYSGGYRVSDMRGCVEMMIEYLVAPVVHDEFFRKYATRKCMKASVICRSWAKKIVSGGVDIFAEELHSNRAGDIDE